MRPSPGRPDQGRTGTIKQRSVYVYVPTEEMLEEWKKAAKNYDVSLSRFIVEVVDDAVSKNTKGISKRAEIEAELAKKVAESASLEEKNEALRSIMRTTDTELAAYRAAISATAPPSHDEEMLRRLFGIFHDRLHWRMQDIPSAIGISTDDQEGMRRLQKTLDWLRELGMIEGDFEEVHCKVGSRKRGFIAAGRRANRNRAKRGKDHPGVRKGLRAEKDDPEHGPIIRW